MNVLLNPLEEPLRDLWKRLTLLGGSLLLVDNQREQFETLIKLHAKHKGWDLHRTAFIGYALPLTDLTGPTEDGWLFHAAAPSRFSAFGPQYFDAAKLLMNRLSAWAAAQGYEAFESFLKQTCARYLQAHPDLCEPRDLAKYVGSVNGSKKPPASLNEWVDFVSSTYSGRNNRDLFRLLRKWAPELADGEKNNNWNMDLVTWYKAAAAARNAATHANLVVKGTSANADLSKYPKCFPCRNENGVCILHLNGRNVDKILEVYANYGFLIFKCLSKRQGYDWEVVDGLKPAKKGKS